MTLPGAIILAACGLGCAALGCATPSTPLRSGRETPAVLPSRDVISTPVRTPRLAPRQPAAGLPAAQRISRSSFSTERSRLAGRLNRFIARKHKSDTNAVLSAPVIPAAKLGARR